MPPAPQPPVKHFVAAAIQGRQTASLDRSSSACSLSLFLPRLLLPVVFFLIYEPDCRELQLLLLTTVNENDTMCQIDSIAEPTRVY